MYGRVYPLKDPFLRLAFKLELLKFTPQESLLHPLSFLCLIVFLLLLFVSFRDIRVPPCRRRVPAPPGTPGERTRRRKSWEPRNPSQSQDVRPGRTARVPAEEDGSHPLRVLSTGRRGKDQRGRSA